MEAGTVAPAAASTGSKTIADLMALAAERHGAPRPSATSATASGTASPTRSSAATVSEIARGLIDLGIEPGDRVSLLCGTRPDGRRATSPSRAPAPSSCRSTRPTRPSECEWVAGNSESRGDRLRGRRAGGQDRRGPRRTCRARATSIVDRRRAATSATPSRSTTCASAAAAATRPSCRARREAVKPEDTVHDHLHLRHHRPAQGLRALARQLPPGA